ncbi:484_t:CDS:10 [Funneliformis caledonium]|uniref:484_t:CDS:1 n=1 Tax=Funneliformis caledonium TaxID=1117310 RepID=A0A9N9FUW5_9GLOM|nr:484_t:CDS:10 [Funneliformis caledonium]
MDSRDLSSARGSQNLEQENDYNLDSKDNIPQRPLEAEKEGNDLNLNSNSLKTTITPVNDLHNAPMHWNKLRNLVIVDEHIPPTPLPPELLNNNISEDANSQISAAEQPQLIKSSSKHDNTGNYQGNALKMLRFKTTVQQKSDVNRLAKDLEKLIAKRHGGYLFTGMGNGSSGGSLGPLPGNDKGSKQLPELERNDSVRSEGNNVNFFSELSKLLKQWKHVVRLPNSSLILAELAKPFYNYPVNAENLLNSTSMNSYFPTSVTAIHALVYTFIHTLVVTGSEREGSNKLFEMVNGFLARLAAGTLISIDPDEMLIGNARVQINKYDSLARCIFLEGLVKCLLVKDVQLRKYIMENLIGKYWLAPDLTMQSLYEHIIQLFAQAAFEMLVDPISSFIDPSNPYNSLPHLILQTLNQYLPSKNLKNISLHVVRSLINVVVSIFALSWSDTSTRSLSLTASNKQNNNHSNQKTSGNESGTENEHSRSSSKGSAGQNLTITSDGLLTPGISKQSSEIDVLKLAKNYVESLWNEGWKNEVIELIKEFEQDNLDRIIVIFEQLVFGINDSMGNDIVKETISDLFAKIEKVNPEKPPANLKKLLLSLSLKHRVHFYKPMLACVASDNESKVAEYLHLISTLLNYISGVELFMQDAELMSVIILSDLPGSTKSDENKHDSRLSASWGSTTIGQCALIMEFAWIIRQLRLQQPTRSKDSKKDVIAKNFLNELEKRISIFMIAKEKSKLLPMPLRVLLCNLFYEIRLYCKTIYRPGWLTRIIDWMIHSSPRTIIYRDSMLSDLNQSNQNNPFVTQSELEMDKNYLNEVEFIFERIRVVYATIDGWNSSDHDRDEFLDVPVPIIPKSVPIAPTTPHTHINPYSDMRRSSAVVPLTDPAINALPRISSKLLKQHLHRFNTFIEDPAVSVLSLLVAVYHTITVEEFTKLAPHIWNKFLNDREHKPFASASFLFILCGEKSPETVKELIMNDLYSTNALVRAMTLRKISSLFGHRNQLLSQPYVSDSNRKRPFRTQAPAIPFVPTDLGTPGIMMYDSPKELKHKGSLSYVVNKKIEELGWDDDDEVDLERSKRTLTPISLLPTFHLDEEEFKKKEESEALQITRDKIRRNVRGDASTSHIQGNANRRRNVSVPILSSFSLRLLDLLDDMHGGVYNLTKEIIMYFLRDDPLLFLRMFFSDLGTFNFETQKKLLTSIHFLISMQHVFPPGFTHILFNHLAGILKWYSRDNKENGLGLMTYVIPTLAEMVPTVNEIIVRDFRKNKIENILCNNGQFWFTDGTPHSMFPRQLTDNEVTFHILDVPLVMFQVAMLRVGHIHFMTNYVIKCPREVYSVKKMIQTFAPTPLTNVNGNSSDAINEEEKYFPDMEKSQKRNSGFKDVLSRKEKDIKLISALRARSWLNFLLSMLKRLNTNYNDRSELNIFLSGANDILLEHANDFGIVGQTLVLYMTVITRFRRLFDNNRGYSIFIPALFKVFCESEKIPPIRLAITFVWYKFFQVHGESFIFQTLGSLTPLILKGSAKSTKVGGLLSSSLYELFKALNTPMKYMDYLGIYDAIDELHITNPLSFDPPPLLNNTIRRRANSSATKFKGGLLGTLNDKTFSLEDLVRLFLTIIAYDPGSLRAEQFVQILQYLIPHLLAESSSVRTLVDEGMTALTEVFLKFSKSSKPIIHSTTNPENNNETMENSSTNKPFVSEVTTQAFGKQWQQNDRMTIKRQFLILVQTYKKYGGMLSDSSHNRMANIIRLMLKDYAAVKIKVSTNFLKDYITDVLLFNTTFEDGRKPIMSFLKQMSTSFRQHYKIIDFSGLIEGLVLITSDKCRFVINDHIVSFTLKDKFVSFGLSVALKPDWEDGESMQLKLCNSLVKLFVALMIHSDQDILSELDKYIPSHQLMAYVVIPICLQYLPEDVYFTSMNSNANHPTTLKAKSSWTRLLSYITKGCNKESIMRSKITFTLRGNNSKQNLDDKDDDNNDENVTNRSLPTTAEAAATFIISFTALKIVLVRAEKYLTQTKGMWVHISQFVRQILGTAGTSQIKSGLYSLGATPAGSNTSVHISSEVNDHSVDRTSSLHFQHHPSSPGGVGLNNFHNSRSSFSSSSHDFVLWTFLELLLFYKLPINLYLRTFIHQKLQNASIGANSLSNRLSALDNIPLSPSLNSNTSSVYKESSRRSKWKSWGGPPAGFQQALNKNLEKGGVGRNSILKSAKVDRVKTLSMGVGGSSTSSRVSSFGVTNGGNESQEHQHHITFTSGAYTRKISGVNNLIHETLNAYSNVRTLMGYLNRSQNSSNSHGNDSSPELRAWSYKQVIDKLKEEKKIVMEAYKGAFNVLGEESYFANDHNSFNEMINNSF